MTIPKGIYPNTFYRVSIKAIIRNKKGEVLLVKEGSDRWSLPGGGMDHGEPFQQALAREMYEEVLIDQPFTVTFRGIDSFYFELRTAWLMWVVCELTFSEKLSYGCGVDADQVAFVDPTLLKGSKHRAERLVYKWCVDEKATVS